MKKTVLGLAILMGCGTTDEQPPGPEILPELTVPPKPENGLQVITPIFENIEPGKDYEVCTWTDQFVTATTDVRSTLSFQNEPPGHHVVLYYTLDKQPPGTQRVCTDTDMASFRFVSGSGANGEVNAAPGNLVFRIPEGAQLVVNHHYLNATDQVLRGQVALNVNFADPGNYIAAGNMAVVDTSIQVPTGKSTHDFECAFDRTYKFWYLVPHMHEWGTHINVDLTRGGNTMRLFDTTWDPSFAFHPPEMRVDPTAPLVVNAGDKLAVHCEWDNDTGRQLSFGFEMCLSFGMTVDDQSFGSRQCNQGAWNPF
jgi:hypothetical protein